MQIVRRFTLYRRRLDPGCFVPDPSRFPPPSAAPSSWILSSQQVLALLDRTGLRRGELLRLCIGDHDPSRHTLLVRMSKFGKSRIVALSRDARRELAAYLQRRLCFRNTASSPLLAHGEQAHKAHSGNGFGRGFRNLWRAAGVLTAFGVAPRVHGMRHARSAHLLLSCYRDNGNPQAVLPVLSRTIGHTSLASTAYCLSWIDPVIEQAVARVACHVRPLAASSGCSHG